MTRKWRGAVWLTARTPGTCSSSDAVERLRRLDLDHFAAERLAAQLLGRGQRDQSPVRQHGDRVAVLGLADVLRRHHQRAAGVAQAAKLGPDRLAQHRIEPGRWLVDEQQHRIVDQRARQLQAALHAARELARASAARLPQVHQLQHLVARVGRASATASRTARRRTTRFRTRSAPRTARSAAACSRCCSRVWRVNLRGS